MGKSKIKYTLLHGRRTCGVKEAPSRRREQDARETEWKLSSITLAMSDAMFAAINGAAAKRTAARQPWKK